MGELVIGADGLARCAWGASAPEYVGYHDDEWGRPVRDDNGLYEKITLEAFQSGLSWLTILRKREGFRKAFRGFVVDKVARFGEKDIARLLADPGIVRNRAKIEAAIANARAAQQLPDGLTALLWSYAPEPRPHRLHSAPRYRNDAGVDRDGEGASAARVPVRRADHRLRLDAGHRNGR